MLDEVIKAWEICDETVTANCPDCPYDIDCENVPGEDLRADTLHYLKEYRSDKVQYEADRKNWEDDLSQKLRFFDEARNKLIAKYKELDIGTLNDPLTWNELKQMEGKPVWVEYGCNFNQKRWVIIHSFHNTGSFCYMDVHGNYPNTFWQKDMGADEYWQAYRKEKG